MANEWQRRSEEVLVEDKKKISTEGIKDILGIYRFMLPYKWSFILGMIFLMCSVSTGLSFFQLFGDLTDIVNGKQTKLSATLEPIQAAFGGIRQLNALAIVFAGVIVLQAAFSFGRIYFFAQVSERTMADIRIHVYEKLIAMPIPFFENRRVGELISRLSSDITQLQDVLSVTIAEFLRQSMTLIIGVVSLFILSPKLTLFMLATFPVLIVLTMFFGRFIRKISKKAQDELANANVVVEETLHSIQIVKAFTNELREVFRYKTALQSGVDASLKAATYRSGFTSFVMFALLGGIVLVLWYGGGEVESGNISMGQLIKFIFFTLLIGFSVGGLGDIYSQLQKTIGASERVKEILAEKTEFDLNTNIVNVPILKGEIRFDSVKFTYPTRPDIQVLKGISLQAKKGEKIGLVGHSGAGKSTISQLLQRFYLHSEGDIWIDGEKIDTYNLPVLRKNIGVVPQEVILFGGTIRENIGYGKLNATDTEILDAAKRANALDFILSFPEGLDTVVGERGVKLSGGQRQRIAIARAILKNPAILILDEATSSLDSESESLVQAALNELMKDRTTIIIAHRLSTIRNADNIYVLDGGKIVESGKHDDLIEVENGIYSNLVRLQFEMNKTL
jgi:ATP-binding cassette, subfamily B, bacterial